MAQMELDQEVTILDKIVKIPTKKAPATVLPTGTNAQYEAAKHIRVAARHLYEPETAHLIVALRKLEAVLSKPRSTKAERIAAYTRVAELAVAHTKQTKERVRTIRDYAQLLPTVPNIPQTNFENIIGAFIAILRSNGWEVRKLG